MAESSEQYRKGDFWAVENLKYSEPHFRLRKAAHILNEISRGNACDLLDVGCGPTALRQVLGENIRYYGIDIAIHQQAPNLIQADFIETPIQFGEKRFDIIVAQGVFEYVGTSQTQKLREIRGLLNAGGTFLTSYVNFGHVRKYVYPPYNNVCSPEEFQGSLSEFFRVKRIIPTAYHVHHHEPSRAWMMAIQMRMNWNIPILSRLFAVEYLFLCCPKLEVVPG